MARTRRIVVAVAVIVGALVATQRSSGATQLHVGIGPYRATVVAAKSAMQRWGDCPAGSGRSLTWQRLTNLLLSIPPHELKSGDTNEYLSPLALSRKDFQRTAPENIHFYSDDTYNGYRRAHWSPGAGYWQIDVFSNETDELSHAERIRPSYGGRYVAHLLRDKYCAGDTSLRSFLNARWGACRTDRCWNTYLQVGYKANGDPDVVTKDEAGFRQIDGGLTSHFCRFQSKPGDIFLCSLVETTRIEGWSDTSSPEGIKDGQTPPPSGPPAPVTPLAHPFFSFVHWDNGHKFAVWLTAATDWKDGEDDNRELVRWEPLGVADKNGPGRGAGHWYTGGTGLQVCKAYNYQDHECRTEKDWSSAGLTR